MSPLSVFDSGLGKTEKLLEELSGLYKASLRWYWRAIALTVAIATVVSAIFQVLIFLDK